jgi:branched-chain amino acid transport system ATP-binding protein
MLELIDVETFYGRKQVLFGVRLNLAKGSAGTLIGRNGMGKTTTVRSIMGFTPARQGRIIFDGRDITRLASYQIARAGVSLVPEGRQIFPNLTVYENLVATAANRNNVQDPWTVPRIYEFFPRLAERHANLGWQLSGGEQQMLAIGRALMTNPKLLVLDEATEGLAPIIRNEIWHCLRSLKAEGQSLLIIDKDIQALTQLGDYHHILLKGKVVWSGQSSALITDPSIYHRFLAV